MRELNADDQRRLLGALCVVLLGATVANAQKVPRPEDVLGFKPGADFKLATYEQALDYYRQLEQASPLIKVFELGKTSMGKPMIYAVVTSQANMAKLDRYKEITRTLSLVAGVTDDAGARAGGRGQGGRLHRRRAARERVRAGAAPHPARLRPGDGRRPQHPAGARQRHHDPGVRESRRHGPARRLVPVRTSARRTRSGRCRGCTTSTRATTTTATPT